VRDDKGIKPTVISILKRTLYRFIPFDVISFLGDRGWHDGLSDTWVCKEEIVKE
jgi:hypothetical protein